MITSDKIATVIANFESVLPLATRRENLDMAEGAVCDENHKCGTVHCHGGWYAVAVFKDINDDGIYKIDFTDGATRMANDLGFERYYQLESWAENNEVLWGNVWGTNMFSLSLAFSPGNKEYAVTLKDIIDHWHEVHDRLYLQEQLNNE